MFRTKKSLENVSVDFLHWYLKYQIDAKTYSFTQFPTFRVKKKTKNKMYVVSTEKVLATREISELKKRQDKSNLLLCCPTLLYEITSDERRCHNACSQGGWIQVLLGVFYSFFLNTVLSVCEAKWMYKI